MNALFAKVSLSRHPCSYSGGTVAQGDKNVAGPARSRIGADRSLFVVGTGTGDATETQSRTDTRIRGKHPDIGPVQLAFNIHGSNLNH